MNDNQIDTDGHSGTGVLDAPQQGGIVTSESLIPRVAIQPATERPSYPTSPPAPTMEPSSGSGRTKATIPEYRPPSWAIVHVANPLTHLLVGELGMGHDGVRMLEVQGRNSGKWHSTPVRLLDSDGKQYLVALQGETQWVRNLRAQGHGRLRLGHQVTEFRAAEMADNEKLPVLRAYFRRWWSQSASLTTVSSPDAPDQEFVMAAARHPVFRVDG